MEYPILVGGRHLCVEEHREKQMETEPSLFYFQKHSFGLTELLPDSSHISQREERGKKKRRFTVVFRTQKKYTRYERCVNEGTESRSLGG